MLYLLPTLSPRSRSKSSKQDAAGPGGEAQCQARRANTTGRTRAVTLVETMFALGIMALFMLGYISAFLQSRRVTEANVLHAAATSLVYGIIEQIKGVDYTTLLPNGQPDPNDPGCPVGQSAPYYTVRVRINPDLTVWLKPVYNIATGDNPTWTSPTLPVKATDPAPAGAIDNVLGSLPLSTVTGTTGQSLALNIWLWIDECPDRTNDVSEVKKITIIYTYKYNDGSSVHTVRDGEVFVRTRYDQ